MPPSRRHVLRAAAHGSTGANGRRKNPYRGGYPNAYAVRTMCMRSHLGTHTVNPGA